MHVAIITEYNPFHNGHQYQINQIREKYGADTTISAIMGGIFSQRGEPYIASPYLRARAAIACGVDLVVELPYPFSACPAGIFALAGVRIASSISADILAFGSECGDTHKLTEIKNRLDSKEISAKLCEYSKNADYTSLSKTKLYSMAYSELYGEDEALSMPNDILGIEYIRAIEKSNSSITPQAFLRHGNYHGGKVGFASASQIRRDFSTGEIDAIKNNVPPKAFDIYKEGFEAGQFGSDIARLESAILFCLRTSDFTPAFSASGLSQRIKKMAVGCDNLEKLIEMSKTKAYTNAEICRSILFTLLQISSENIQNPEYFRVFGANERGRKALKCAKGKIEMLTKPADYGRLNNSSFAQFKNTFKAEQAFSLCLGSEYNFLKQTPFFD